ncbi:hypothetical protein MIB92_02060 [Aestuariirhabdus sp. Z084]|uniref:hypothetical protein n=1 Tax=Aestuariirhabdus haliotis TaxID=2918751 RepID=UPI00201B429B|nr:hypothetical protein [Aestuariirhabdus haliotis]MCL6414424.1 hypothetical protein [Aestuariirhabdus haliotis]MCL6418594.1 hypothetical protein [Aestuariirhabdus haliotis]
MITRKLGALLRGNTTPAQLAIGSMLAVVLGFLPGFSSAPGLMLATILLLLVFNANLTLVGLLFAVAKLLSLLLQPLSFAIGRVLLEGGTESFFVFLVNTPVLALFGFEYYLTTGALVLGLVLGAACAFALIVVLGGFRRKMASLEKNSDLYANLSAGVTGKLITWVFLGSGSGQRYEEVLQARGKLIRWPGVLVAIALCLLLWLAQSLLASSWVIEQLRGGLERANGATVELEGGTLDLADGRLVLEGLAMTDPNHLDRNLFSADRIEANLSSMDLLRKRLRLDRVAISGGAYGSPRAVAGQRLVEPVQEASTAAPVTAENEINGSRVKGDLDQFITTGQLWRQRFQQLAQWVERLPLPSEGKTTTAAESLEERLRREIERYGYASVRANHLVQQVPSLSVGELFADKVAVTDWPQATLEIRAREISSQPWLSSQTPRIEIESSDQRLLSRLTLGQFKQGGGENKIGILLQKWPAEPLLEQLKLDGDTTLRGGELALKADGILSVGSEASIELPLNVVLTNATLAIEGAGEAPIKRLKTRVQLTGPLASPAISVDQQGLKDDLAAAAGDLVKARVKQETDKHVEQAREKAQKEVESKLGQEVGGALKGIFD